MSLQNPMSPQASPRSRQAGFCCLCLMAFCLAAGSPLEAGKEIRNARLAGSDLFSLSQLSAADDKFSVMASGPPSSWGFANKSAQGRILFLINHASPDLVDQPFKATLTIGSLTVERHDGNGFVAQALPQPVVMQVEYDPSSGAEPFQDRDAFLLPDAHRLQLADMLLEIDPPGLTPPNLALEAEVEVERFYDFDPLAVPPEPSLSHLFDPASDEIEIRWIPVLGAEEYDLEWTHINDYQGDSLAARLDPALIEYSFRNNSSRVTLSRSFYRIPAVFESGYLLYRMRGIGRGGPDFEERVEGAWSSESFDPAANVAGFRHRHPRLPQDAPLDHEPDANWQFIANFAEEGKKKESVSYFDGSLRNRQAVTRNNSDNLAIVGETVYDHQGRAAIQVLPVPAAGDPRLRFFESFNLNQPPQGQQPAAYSRLHFDLDDPAAGECQTTAQGMSTGSGASRYYSPQNPDQTGHQAYLPDAGLHPFTQIEFEPDNTGRIRRQSGVGPLHKLGNSLQDTHETKFFYSQPLQHQLDRLFGSEAGDKSHYKKNFVVDANGQISVSYLDVQGRVVATALAGKPPDNLDALTRPDGKSLYESQRIDWQGVELMGSDNHLMEGSSRIFSSQLPVTSPSAFQLHYELTGESFAPQCAQSDACYDCVYDLSISLRDRCGKDVLQGQTVSGLQVGDLPGLDPQGNPTPQSRICSLPDRQISLPQGQHLLRADLLPGVYTIEKKLSLNQQALDFYVEQSIRDNTCLKTLEDFEQEALADIDLASCQISCDECVSGLGTANEFQMANPDLDYAQAVRQCQEPCRRPNLCRNGFDMMLADVSPGGQYAEYEIVNDAFSSASFQLSLLNENNLLAGQPSWRQPLAPYRDPDGKESFITVDVNQPQLLFGVQPQPIPGRPGELGVRPQDLARVEDFALAYWQPSWAESLVGHHPEFCYFETCRLNSEVPAGATLSSDAFDDLLRDTEGAVEAAQKGLIDPAANPDIQQTLDQDPYFGSGGLGSADRPFMLQRISNYQGSGKTMQEMANLADQCPNAYDAAAADQCLAQAGGSRIVRDLAWQFYRDFYLTAKQRLQQIRADDLARQNGCYNGCIESERYSPVAEGMVRFSGGRVDTSFGFFDADQTCSFVRHWLFKSKDKRFRNAKEALGALDIPVDPDGDPAQALQTLQNQADYQLFLQTGQCPLALDLQHLMDALAQRGALRLPASSPSAAVELDDDFPQFTPRLFESVHPQSQPFVQYGWRGIPSGTELHAAILDPQGNPAGPPGCQLNRLVTLSAPSTGWDSPESLLRLDAIRVTGFDAASNRHTFEINALVGDPANPQTELLMGSTCLDISSCDFADQCRPSPNLQDLGMLISLLAGERGEGGSSLTQSGGVDLSDSPYRELLEITFLAGSDWSWQHLPPSSFILRSSDPSLPGYAIHFDQQADFGAIQSISSIEPIPSALSRFLIRATTSDAQLELTAQIVASAQGGTSLPFDTGSCGPPPDGECRSREHRVRDDLENMLNHLAENITQEQPLSRQQDFSDLLQSYAAAEINLLALAGTTPGGSISMMQSGNTTPTGSINFFWSPATPDPSTLTATILDPSDPQGPGCRFELRFLDRSTPHRFADIVSFSDLRADTTRSVSGQSFHFTILAHFITGRHEGKPVFQTELLEGHSCFPLKNCSVCRGGQLRQANLAPNFGLQGTLQQGNACPLRGGELHKAAPWYAPTNASSDLDSRDCPFGSSGSSTAPGRCSPHPGRGGIFAYLVRLGVAEPNPVSNYREYLQAPLRSPLEAGKKYRVRFKVRHSGRNSGEFGQLTPVFADGMGAFFSRGPLTDYSRPPVQAGNPSNNVLRQNRALVVPQVSNPQGRLLDGNCIVVSGEFEALGGEDHVTIGNFLDDAATTLSGPPGRSGVFGAYYFIEDISVIPEEGACQTPSITPLPGGEWGNPCQEHLRQLALKNAAEAYAQFLEEVKAEFRTRYTQKCLMAPEELTLDYTESEYHHTLYYYDQAGNLTKTVPPEGVELLTAEQVERTRRHREDPSDLTRPFQPSQHRLVTRYGYNSLNQLVRQHIPDHEPVEQLQICRLSTGFFNSSNSVFFIDAQTGYAAGPSGRILSTSDGGESWTVITPAISDENLAQIIFINPATGFAVGQNGKILKTADGGKSWTAPSSGSSSALRGIQFINPREGFIVGDGGLILKTADQGESWAEAPPTAPTAANLHDIDFVDSSTGYAVGSQGTVLRTVNAAAAPAQLQWQTAATLQGNLNAIDFVDRQTGYIVGNIFGAVQKGTIWKTEDGGQSWTEQESGTEQTLVDVAFTDREHGYAVGNRGTFLTTSDGGASWVSRQTGLTALLTGISVVDDSRIFISGGLSGVNGTILQASLNRWSTRFWYDSLGRLRFSQNSQQYARRNASAPNPFDQGFYSYTRYDALGRIIEVGESDLPFVQGNSRLHFSSGVDDAGFPPQGREVTRTYYDRPAFSVPGFNQEHLRNRVASVTIEEEDDGNDQTYDHATHYSYDIHGNVESLVQDNPLLGIAAHRYKRVDYLFDLVSGNVNQVLYQQGQPDQFLHRYEYDADNRLTNVHTSSDGVHWDQDAKYFYYQHGPLARTELGDLKVQGVDYAYTLQGWLKGINSNSLDEERDIGQDGRSGSVNSLVARDAYGLTLGYFNSDYQSIDPSLNGPASFQAQLANSSLQNETAALFNGNISHMVTALAPFMEDGASPQGMSYRYDQLNRLKQAVMYDNLDRQANQWGTTPASPLYRVGLEYDANGNILKLNRSGDLATTSAPDMDSLTYRYRTRNGKMVDNRLLHVNDSIPASAYSVDIDDQGPFMADDPDTWNYDYDAIGNLSRDAQEEIEEITWNAYGKIRQVLRSESDHDKPDLEFRYDATGNRLLKLVKPRESGQLSGQQRWISTWYVRDPSGNILAIYTQEPSQIPGLINFFLSENQLYGSRRVGVIRRNLKLDMFQLPSPQRLHLIGARQFEVANHLADVLAVVTDSRIPSSLDQSIVDSFEPVASTASHYYPFGLRQPGKNLSENKYRFGFNGTELDNELNGDGNSYNFGFRNYDPRIGKFFRIDPFFFYFRNQSNYASSGNNPIFFKDANGGFRLPPGVSESDHPQLTNVLRAVGRLVAGEDSEVLENPIVRAFIRWGQIKGTDAEKLEAVRSLLEYGEGPVVRLASNFAAKGLGAPAFGFTASFPRGARRNSININRRLVRRTEGVENLNIGKIELDKFDPIQAQLILFMTVLHEGVHLSAQLQRVNERESKLEFGFFFEHAAFPEFFGVPTFNSKGQVIRRGNFLEAFKGPDFISGFGFDATSENFDAFFNFPEGEDIFDVRPPTDEEKEIEQVLLEFEMRSSEWLRKSVEHGGSFWGLSTRTRKGNDQGDHGNKIGGKVRSLSRLQD